MVKVEKTMLLLGVKFHSKEFKLVLSKRKKNADYFIIYCMFRITQIAVAPAGFAIATSSWDQTVRVWGL